MIIRLTPTFGYTLVSRCKTVVSVLSIKRGTLYKTEVSPCTHDLAILLPILYSVSRVNAYLNSQHPYECPYYKLPMP